MAGLNENLESANDNNRPQKKSITSSTFLQHFVKDHVEKIPAALRNELIEEAMTKDTLSGTKVALALAEFRASDEKYSDVDISGEAIDVFMIRKHLAKGFVQLGRARQDIEQKILKEYEVTPEIFNSKLKTPLKGQSLSDLLGYIKSEYKLAAFLKNNLGTEVKSRVKFDMLAGISEKQMQNRVRAMGDDERNEVTPVLLKIQNGGSPRDDEIRTIVESSLFDETQKVRFVHQFLPYITLQQALDIQLISEKKAESIKEQYIKDAIIDTTLSSDNLVHLGENISLSDIQVATKDIVTNAAESVKISEGVGFAGFESDVRVQREEALEELRKNGPKTFEALKVALSALGEIKIAHAELFSPGNIVEFTKRRTGGEEDKDYVRIIDFDDAKQEFRYQNIGNDQINLKSNSDAKTVRYEDFFMNLKSDPTTCQVMTQSLVQERLKKGEIKNSELTHSVAADFEGDEMQQKRDEVKQKRIDELEAELKDLENKLAVEGEDGKKNTNLQAEIIAKKKEISDFQGKILSFEEYAELSNIQELIKKLDEVDVEGKGLGLKKGMVFHTGKGDSWNTYTIRDIDTEAWEINITSRAGVEKPINLDDFFTQFKKQEAKREKAIISPEELIQSIETWKDVAFKDGDIIQKDAEDGAGKKDDREVEYFASEKGKKLLKIVSLSGGIAEVQVGEIQDGKLSDGEKERGDKKRELRIKGANTEQWSLDELKRFIQDYKLIPDWKLGKTIVIKPQNQQHDFKGSLTERLFQNISIYELIHGGKMVIEGITESMKRGSDVKSAKAALALGGFLPEELREDLRAKVESAESEEMDKEIKKLGAVDSVDAVKRIRKWLLNRDVPEYKKEAGLLFMLEKYGHLTAKGPLAEFRGKFLWYEAFGGHIGDKLYNEEKEKAEKSKPPQIFSEEQLMLQLLKKQCKSETRGYNGIQRRSRLHKEFDGKWKAGIKAELEKGYNDASNYRDVETIIREALGEAKGGTTSNAIGWMKRIPELGGSLEQMCHVPFALLTSGTVYNIDQATYKHAKSLWDGDGQPVILLRMFGDKAKMDLFNETFLALSYEIGEAYKEDYPNIGKEAQEIYDAAKNGTGKESDRIEQASKFWKKYGTPLSRTFHNSLESESDTSKTDTLISRNEKFKKYNDFVRGAVGEGKAFNEDIIQDWAQDTGVFGLNVEKLTSKYLALTQQGGFRNGDTANIIWGKIRDDINSTPQKLFIGNNIDSPENKSEQEKHIVRILEEFMGAQLELHGGNLQSLRAMNNPTLSLGSTLNSWGIHMIQDFHDNQISSSSVISGEQRGYFQKVAKNILSGNTGTGGDKTPDILKARIQSQALDSLNNPGR